MHIIGRKLGGTLLFAGAATMAGGFLPMLTASAGTADSGNCVTGTSQVKATSDVHTALLCVMSVTCTNPDQRKFAVLWSAGHSADEPASITGVVNAELGKTSPGKTKSATATASFTGNTASGAVTITWPPDSNGEYPPVELAIGGIANPCPTPPPTTVATTTTTIATTTTTTTPPTTSVAPDTTGTATTLPTSATSATQPVPSEPAPTNPLAPASPQIITPTSVASLSATTATPLVLTALPRTGAEQNVAMVVVGLSSTLCGAALLGVSRRRPLA